MNIKDKQEEESPVAYPRPTETDNQLKNQPEYIDQEPNKYTKGISGLEEDKSMPGNE